nr:hypothetical protein CFP56_33628 [Quercus suber]
MALLKPLCPSSNISDLELRPARHSRRSKRNKLQKRCGFLCRTQPDRLGTTYYALLFVGSNLKKANPNHSERYSSVKQVARAHHESKLSAVGEHALDAFESHQQRIWKKERVPKLSIMSTEVSANHRISRCVPRITKPLYKCVARKLIPIQLHPLRFEDAVSPPLHHHHRPTPRRARLLQQRAALAGQDVADRPHGVRARARGHGDGQADGQVRAGGQQRAQGRARQPRDELVPGREFHERGSVAGAAAAAAEGVSSVFLLSWALDGRWERTAGGALVHVEADASLNTYGEEGDKRTALNLIQRELPPTFLIPTEDVVEQALMAADRQLRGPLHATCRRRRGLRVRTGERLDVWMLGAEDCNYIPLPGRHCYAAKELEG